MAKYLIHACNDRMWYVNEYLIPSMLQQGIADANIEIWQDKENAGNLISTINSFAYIANNSGGTWHLQDDIIISKRFKEATEEMDSGIKLGFCNTYSKENPPGYVNVINMWYSFPCIRLPNSYAGDFVKWFEINKYKYSDLLEANKGDDEFFREYMLKKHPTLSVVNISPNIVENIDYLIGGSIINKQRQTQNINSIYWNEPERVEALRMWLRSRKNK